jgi:hypothetical protein
MEGGIVITFLKILLVVLSAVAALVIEICLIAYEIIHAGIDVLLLGNGKARLRRMYR